MKRTLFLSAMVLAAALTASAEPVGEAKARQTAISFMNGRSVTQDNTFEQAVAAARTSHPSLLTSPLYIYNVENDGGFVIVSGDDATVSILAYGTQGSISYDRMPENVKCVVDGYAEQISLMQEQGTTARRHAPAAERTTIEPLLTSQWGQGAPFNDECPMFLTGTRSVTGCMATALAQLMYYYRLTSVDKLQADITDYTCARNWGAYVHVDGIQKGTPIEWSLMVDRYNGSESAESRKAVATLMKMCGAALRMDYADEINGGSTATAITAVAAAKKYFGYSTYADIIFHDEMTDSEWDNAIYHELQLNRPVLISGQTPTNSGHAFMCDGYDSQTDKYHINWGWEGYCDGYFELKNLEPAGQGTGGTEGGYNSQQSALLYMVPGNGEPYEEPIALTTVNIKLTGEATTTRNYFGQAALSCSFRMANGTTDKHDFQYALAAYDVTGNFVGLVTGVSQYNGLPTNAYLNATTTCFPGMYAGNNARWPAGTYRIYIVSREAKSDVWIRNLGNKELFITAAVTDKDITYCVGEPQLNAISPTLMDSERVSGEKCYDLQGRRVKVNVNDNANVNGKKGLYIINGKKIVIR